MALTKFCPELSRAFLPYSAPASGTRNEISNSFKGARGPLHSHHAGMLAAYPRVTPLHIKIIVFPPASVIFAGLKVKAHVESLRSAIISRAVCEPSGVTFLKPLVVRPCRR